MTKIKPAHRKRTVQPLNEGLTLDYLLANVTPENLHPETDWDPPVGKERWWE